MRTSLQGKFFFYLRQFRSSFRNLFFYPHDSQQIPGTKKMVILPSMNWSVIEIYLSWHVYTIRIAAELQTPPSVQSGVIHFPFSIFHFPIFHSSIFILHLWSPISDLPQFRLFPYFCSWVFEFMKMFSSFTGKLRNISFCIPIMKTGSTASISCGRLPSSSLCLNMGSCSIKPILDSLGQTDQRGRVVLRAERISDRRYADPGYWEIGFLWHKDDGRFWIRRWFRTLPQLLPGPPDKYRNRLFRCHHEHFFISTGNSSSSCKIFSGPFTDFFWESWSLSIEEWFYLVFRYCLGWYSLGKLFGFRKNTYSWGQSWCCCLFLCY